MSPRWTLQERARALARAEREVADLIVIGGGITGAGILREAAARGLRACLLEREDFGCGTSSRSSKLVHGGLRYLAQGRLGLTREACRERNRMLRQDPNLVRPLPFLLPVFADGRLSLGKIRAALWLYDALAGFRPPRRSRLLGPEEAAARCRLLRREGLLGAGLYYDAQADDVRLVLEAIKSARRLGAEAVSHAEAVGFERDASGRLVAVRVLDRLEGRTRSLRAHAFVNATGPHLERVLGLDPTGERLGLRPAKGVHLVLPRARVPVPTAVAFEASDGRSLFLIPWDDVVLLGTTDSFSDEVDEPVVTIEEVHYLLEAANRAFPGVALTTNDLRSVFAGVRPLVAEAGAERPPSSVSREHRVVQSRSGLVSVAGGKLTTFQAMAEAVLRSVVRRLPRERVKGARRASARRLPLREDRFERAELEARLARRFGVSGWRAAHLVRTWGAESESLLEAASPALRRPIGGSRYLYAELPWALETECPATLCDLLERRLRLPIFAIGQGLAELERIAEVVGRAAGWDGDRIRAEAAAYAESVRRRYQIVAEPPDRRERHAA